MIVNKYRILISYNFWIFFLATAWVTNVGPKNNRRSFFVIWKTDDYPNLQDRLRIKTMIRFKVDPFLTIFSRNDRLAFLWFQWKMWVFQKRMWSDLAELQSENCCFGGQTSLAWGRWFFKTYFSTSLLRFRLLPASPVTSAQVTSDLWKYIKKITFLVSISIRKHTSLSTK